MAFLRFVVPTIHPDSAVETGLFQVAAKVRDSAEVSEHDRVTLTEHLNWFNKNLKKPTRFNRSSSKGHYRRATKGISWFKDTSHDHLSRMHDIKRIAEMHGHRVSLVKEDRIGYIVYEDEFQVVSEPFSDTRTYA